MEVLKQKVSTFLGNGKGKAQRKSYKQLPELDVPVPTSTNTRNASGVSVPLPSDIDSVISKRKIKHFRSLDNLLHSGRTKMKCKKNSYSQLPAATVDSGLVVEKDLCCDNISVRKENSVHEPHTDSGNLMSAIYSVTSDHSVLTTTTSVLHNRNESSSTEVGGQSPESPDSCSLSPCSSSDGDGRLDSPGSEIGLVQIDQGIPHLKPMDKRCDCVGDKMDMIVDLDENTPVNTPEGKAFGSMNADPSVTCDDNFKVPVMRKSTSSRRLSLSIGFELPRFRKRKHNSNKENDDDNISVQSLDVSNTPTKKKSKKSLLRVSASLANLISPNKNKSNSEGFKVPSSPRQVTTSPYRPPQPSPAKSRVQLTWAGRYNTQTLSHTDIKRQEAIYELYQGEKAVMEDLINVSKLYRDSLITLGLISQEEVNNLFGNIDELIPVHKDLTQRLQGQRRPDGTTHNIGSHILEWTESLHCYVDYCANQIQAKAIFDEIKNHTAVDDFFQRCLASSFSRKLDLWTLLDGAKARFIKYPLLIRSIIKYTPSDCGDAFLLEKAVKRLEEIIRDADDKTGLAKCEFSKSSLVYLFDEQRVPEIEISTSLVCSGCMKNTKGSKLYVFVYDKVVVVSRSTNQNGRQMYQVYRQPIPLSDLVVEDLPDGEVKLGSFRNAFGQGGQTGKNLIRISFKDNEKGQAHTLIANDEHDKRQWVQSFQKVTSVIVQTPPSSSSSSSSENKSKDKQSSS